ECSAWREALSYVRTGCGSRHLFGCVVEESGRLGTATQPLELTRVGKLRLVALGVHHAEETQRRTGACPELMPRRRRGRAEVQRADREDRFPDQHSAGTAQNHHRVHVLVTLERRMAARRHFEIAQLAAQVGPAEQRLPRDIAERRRALLFVAQLLDPGPAIVVSRGSERTHRRFAHGLPPDACTAETKSRACAARPSRATSKLPPISSIVSSPKRARISATRATVIPPAGTGTIGASPCQGARAASATARQTSADHEKRPPAFGKIVASAPKRRN